MGYHLEKIFIPSLGVDLVFNTESLAPYSRSSIIYDISPAANTVTIAQPQTPFTQNTTFRDLYLTTIIRNDDRKIRVGLKCISYKIIDHYPLANKETVPAVCLTYELPIKETNIRSAFRLPLNTKYIIKGKILFKGFEYYTSRDFTIRDISLTGIGLLVPRKRKRGLNPLNEIEKGSEIVIGVILIDVNKKEPVGTIPIKAVVKRINRDHSPNHTLVGLKILDMKSQREQMLNQFIHAAQIDELKRRRNRNL